MNERLVYVQESGRLYLDGVRIALCYSGNGVGLDNPAMQEAHSIGPLPCGAYTPVLVQVSHLGGWVLRLDPDPTNMMFGRADFFIHYDNTKGDFSASEGCIVPTTMWAVYVKLKALLPLKLRVVARESDRAPVLT